MISPSSVVAATLVAARPDEAPVNEAVLAELRGYQKPGEPDFVTQLIGIFNNDVISRLGQMKSGVEASDARRVSQAAHALKGASGELGAAGLQAICSRLEEGTAHGSLEAAGPMLRELEAEADRYALHFCSLQPYGTTNQMAEPAHAGGQHLPERPMDLERISGVPKSRFRQKTREVAKVQSLTVACSTRVDVIQLSRTQHILYAALVSPWCESAVRPCVSRAGGIGSPLIYALRPESDVNFPLTEVITSIILLLSRIRLIHL
jgi:HPt (histidine-containing phosphotransfer) domain-containing protein